jgi:MFS family permease
MELASPQIESRTAPERATNVRWQIVTLLLAYSFMTWFNRVSMAVAYDEQIKAELGISKEQIGAVYSAFLFAYMIFMTPGSWLADRIGAAGALSIMGIGSGLLGALTGLPVFLAYTAGQALAILFGVRGLMGIFTAPVYPASARMTAHWVPLSQRALVNGLITAAALLGIAVCYPAFGTLQDHVHWSWAFLITGSITLARQLAGRMQLNRGAQHFVDGWHWRVASCEW